MSLVQLAGGSSNLSAPILRRRRTVAVLLALTTAAVLVAAGSNTTAAWIVVAVVAIIAAAYLGLAHRTRRVATERAFAASQPGYLEVLAEARLAESSSPTIDAVGQVQPSTWALLRFAVSYAAGWALSPLVFALTILAGRTPRDATSQRWLANIQAAQDRLREQSLRTLAVSAATTASVTAAGTLAVLGAPNPASAATVTASASIPASISGTTHRVVAGDTLWGIANHYGVTIQAIAGANRISDPNLIYPGQVLFIPGGRTAVSAPRAVTSPPTRYTVRAGDTLSAIASRFGTTVSALAAANHIANPNFIEVGEVLFLRGGTPTSTMTRTTLTSAPAPAPATTAAQIAVRTALAQVGKPYQWAGAGPYSFDCSGLVMYAWEHAGVQLPHYSVAQYEDTTRISEGELRPGDLVFYDTGDGAEPGHVTIYIGNGEVVTADSPGTYVRVVSLTWDGRPMGFGRVR